MGVKETDPLTQLSLPPGFRFYPTDEELLVQYLCKKVAGHQFPLQIIGEIDLYKYDPWLLPSKAIFGEKEWYFFSPRDRKYPNGSRPNRVAGSGYWKATGTDKVITTEGRKVGIKKALVFYVGKAPKGTKTNWIMHEYRLLDSSRKHGSTKLDDWVLCRIYKKNSSGGQRPMLFSSSVSTSSKEQSTSSSPSSHLEDVLDCLPEIDERFLNLPRVNSLKQLNLNNLGSGNFDWATLAGLNSVPELGPRNLVGYSSVNGNDIYTPGSMYQGVGRMGNSLDDEVQSGSRTQQTNNSNMFTRNSTNSSGLTQGSINQVDAYGSRYLINRVSGLGLGSEK